MWTGRQANIQLKFWVSSTVHSCRMALGDGINYRCDRTRSVKEPELCIPTVETLSLGSVSHLRFQFVIPWRGSSIKTQGEKGGAVRSYIVYVCTFTGFSWVLIR